MVQMSVCIMKNFTCSDEPTENKSPDSAFPPQLYRGIQAKFIYLFIYGKNKEALNF